MDEECLRPGDPTDITLITKMNNNLGYHKHYISHQKSDIQTQKTMGRDVIQSLFDKIKHFILFLFFIILGIPFDSLRWRCNI